MEQAMTEVEPIALELRRVIDAPPERVFQAWTTPDELRQWHFADPNYDQPLCEVDLKVSGRFRIGGHHKRLDAFHIASGVYREIDPPKKLVFTWRWRPKSLSIRTRRSLRFTSSPRATRPK